MKIILLEKVENLGNKGEVKEVKKGFFRNFLFVRDLAKIANAEEVIRIEEEKKRKEEALKKEMEKLEKLAAKLAKKKIIIETRLIGGRRIFGSVKPKDIAEKLGLKEKQININRPIKEAGEHKVIVNLGRGVKTEIIVNIVSKKRKK